MLNKNNKTSSAEFKHDNDNFNMEAAKELGIDLSNSNTNLTTAKILYAYELGLKNKL